LLHQPFTTTLNRIWDHEPCERGWLTLLEGLAKVRPDDEPLPYSRIVETNGLKDAVWACRAEPHYDKEWRLFAVQTAKYVEHLFTRPESTRALIAAELFAHGRASVEELTYAHRAADEDIARIPRTGGHQHSAWAAWSATLSEASAAASFTFGDVSRAVWFATQGGEERAATVILLATLTEEFLSLVG